MRKLATVRKISNLSAIQGADRIECATIDGWEVVVKKGEFKEGDLCVYFEIDSILPVEPRYGFLGSSKLYDNVPGYRIKTMKLRKQLSQGLALPLSSFLLSFEPKEGDDLTIALGVRKYEPEVKAQNNGSNPAGVFPSFLKKTDQERIQNKVKLFDSHKDHKFEITKKLDGSSITVFNRVLTRKGLFGKLLDKIFGKKEEFGVCSRNLQLKEPSTKNMKSLNNFWYVVERYNLRELLKGTNIALQGELVAPNIQNNHEKVTEPDMYVFDIYDIAEQQYILPNDRHAWMVKHKVLDTGLKHVPVVAFDIAIFRLTPTLPELLEFVEGESINPDTISEGMVFKSTTNPELSFKTISNQYLLKCEK